MILKLLLRVLSTLLSTRRKKRRGFFGWLWTRVILLALIGFIWYLLVEPQGGEGKGYMPGRGGTSGARPGMRRPMTGTAGMGAPRVINQRQPASQAPAPTAPPLAERPAPVEEALSSSTRGVRLERPAGASVPTAPPPFEAAEEEALAAPTPDTLAPAGEAAKAQADDLALIEGIGPRISARLKQNGINTFEALANTGRDRLESILSDANLNMVDPSTWAEQARLAAAGDWDGFERLKKELKRGRRA